MCSYRHVYTIVLECSAYSDTGVELPWPIFENIFSFEIILKLIRLKYHVVQLYSRAMQ